MPAIQQVDYATTVHRIARQTIRMPSKDSVCIAVFNTRNHFIKHRTTGDFGRLFFNQFFGDMQTFLLGKDANFGGLALKKKTLLALNTGGLGGKKKNFFSKKDIKEKFFFLGQRK